MSDPEVPLAGGRVTAGVVRVGETVRRPLGSHSPFVQRLLVHLEACGVPGVPRWLGLDSSGRETLSFLHGDVPSELAVWQDAQLEAAAHLLRRLHDATVDCDLRAGSDIVCHGDPSPCNFVFVDGMPVGMIDFDAAHPGRRRDDIGYAAWLWLEIGHEDRSPEEQGRKLARFVRAYGDFDLDDAVPAMLDVQAKFCRRTDTPVNNRAWVEGCRAWLERHADRIVRGMR